MTTHIPSQASSAPVIVGDEQVWAQRRKRSVRMAWGLGALVLMLFLIAIWKYRPLA